jgi:hypothetical protein
MFLTPFIDLGDTIENFCLSNGSPNLGNTSPSNQTMSSKQAIDRARIVSVSDKVKIISANERGTTMEGAGIAIGSGPLDQSKAYFEILVEAPDTSISVGAIGRNPNAVLAEGWQVLSKVPNSICVPLGVYQPGQVIGVMIDISNFPQTVTGYEFNDVERKSVSARVRGELWPALEIHSGSVTTVFGREHLKYLTPIRISRGVEAVMLSRSII